MASHPGQQKRHFPEELPVAWDSIRWALEENEDWYRDLVEHSQDLLCVHDLEGRFLSVNPGSARLLGYTVEEMLRKPMRDFFDPQSRDQFDAYLREIGRTGESHGLMALLTRSGERRIWEYHNTLRTEGVETPIVRGIAHDVTERVRAEKALRAANEELVKTAQERERVLHELTLFRTLLDQSNDAIEIVDPETLRFLDVNERACIRLGYSREELLSMTIFDIGPSIDESVVARLRQQLEESGFASIETVQRRKDGTTFPVEVNLRRVRLDREYNVVVARDITARKRGEEALRKSEELLHLFVEHAPAGLAMFDREMRYLHVSRRWRTDYGLGDRDLRGVSHYELFPEIPERWKEFHRRGLAGEVLREENDRFDRADGSAQWVRWEILPWHDSTGGIGGIVICAEEITERKRAEAALRKSEWQFRAVYERSPIGIALVDTRSGRFLQVNPKFCEIAGRREEELLQTDLESITHPEDVGQTSESLQHLAEEELANYEVDKRYLRPDGSVRWVRVQVVPMWGKGETRRWHMGLVEDITERRRTEEALRQSEERFRVALKNSPIAVFSQDRDLRYTWSYNSQLPSPASEKLGKTMDELFEPEEAARLTEVRRRVLETGVGVRDEMQVTFGGRKHYLDTTIEPVLDATGAVIGLTGASMDVTELREASEELREAKRKLTEEKLYLEQEIDAELGLGEIIGQSKVLQAMMEQVGKVAASDATVLLLGETGTGKELVARAIHQLSHRADNSFIKMNCAAIPSGLLESELFGNEKGAFTGAVNRKIGRLELADKGTLFLDEIGEISLALQPKLLRVLQDREFERLGGIHTLKVDFRLIAATNRDLADAVREKEFRSDLYYRLNVFPIRVPPLRERREDIRLLVEHFVQKCARRMNKSITSIPKRTVDALMGWEWPGNVRELENFIERSVILTQGSVLESPLSELRPVTATEEEVVDESLGKAEREHILRALRESHGQIGGRRGAAMRLGLKRTTLQSKLKQLGINPRATPPGH
jgi:formate hydrogenlyase transcriptional activator